MACAAVSAITMCHYYLAVIGLVSRINIRATSFQVHSPYFVDKDTRIKYTDEEKFTLTTFSLTIIFSIFEIILAFASVMSGDLVTDYQPARSNRVFQAT